MKPFSSELGITDNVPILDGAIDYYFQYIHQTYILIIRNALYIPTINHKLIPPFLMRSGGVIVNDIPKLHFNYPTSSYHCISLERNDLKIPLKLSGTLSYFYSRLLHVKEIQECKKVFITQDSDDWNPHCEYFDKNENVMTNFEVEMVEDKRNTNYAMEISNYNNMFQNCFVSINNLDKNIYSTIRSVYEYDPGLHKQLNSNVDKDFVNDLSLRGEISNMSE